jgi:hypothetical protein
MVRLGHSSWSRIHSLSGDAEVGFEEFANQGGAVLSRQLASATSEEKNIGQPK